MVTQIIRNTMQRILPESFFRKRPEVIPQKIELTAPTDTFDATIEQDIEKTGGYNLLRLAHAMAFEDPKTVGQFSKFLDNNFPKQNATALQAAATILAQCLTDYKKQPLLLDKGSNANLALWKFNRTVRDPFSMVLKYKQLFKNPGEWLSLPQDVGLAALTYNEAPATEEEFYHASPWQILKETPFITDYRKVSPTDLADHVNKQFDTVEAPDQRFQALNKAFKQIIPIDQEAWKSFSDTEKDTFSVLSRNKLRQFLRILRKLDPFYNAHPSNITSEVNALTPILKRIEAFSSPLAQDLRTIFHIELASDKTLSEISDEIQYIEILGFLEDNNDTQQKALTHYLSSFFPDFKTKTKDRWEEMSYCEQKDAIEQKYLQPITIFADMIEKGNYRDTFKAVLLQVLKQQAPKEYQKQILQKVEDYFLSTKEEEEKLKKAEALALTLLPSEQP